MSESKSNKILLSMIHKNVENLFVIFDTKYSVCPGEILLKDKSDVE